MTKTELKLLQFLGDYEHVITNAVQAYIGEMTAAAQEAQGAYDSIKDDPEKVRKQDQTFMTTQGLAYSAQLFRESAEQAQRALDALEELAGEMENL